MLISDVSPGKQHDGNSGMMLFSRKNNGLNWRIDLWPDVFNDSAVPHGMYLTIWCISRALYTHFSFYQFKEQFSDICDAEWKSRTAEWRKTNQINDNKGSSGFKQNFKQHVLNKIKFFVPIMHFKIYTSILSIFNCFLSSEEQSKKKKSIAHMWL